MNNPNYKLGIKKLTDSQMATGLPGYSMLIGEKGKIDKIREQASNISVTEQLVHESFETLKYDHIFSILGGRGAGKTSVMLTMYHNFKEKAENIVFPIIMPELIEEDEDIISWLLSAMARQLDQLEGRIRDIGYRKEFDGYGATCEKYKLFERCAFNSNNILRQRYDELKNAYYTRIYKFKADSYAEAREWMAQSAECSFSLMRMFVEYWNTLIEVYAAYLMTSGKTKGKTPLIFIFIDDADLKPQILNELLFVIPKYLSHPNVVVFVSASQKTLKYAVKNYMYKEITHNAFDLPALMGTEYAYNGGRSEENNSNMTKFHELRYGKEYDKINKLSDEILRKLFPVYNRLYLKKYERNEEKALFPIFKNDDANCDETVALSIGIHNLIQDFHDTIIGLHENGGLDQGLRKSKTACFKVLNIDDGNYTYLSFFGRYPRDIMSTYYALKDMFNYLEQNLKALYNSPKEDRNNLKKNLESYANAKETPSEAPEKDSPKSLEPDIERVYEIVIKFLDSAVMSNRGLLMFSRIVRELVKTKLLRWQLFVDYARVLEVFKDPRYVEENKKNPDSFVEMMCLLNFVEQIIVLVMPERKKTHGAREFVQLIELAGIEIIQKNNQLDNMLHQYYTFHSLNIVPRFDIERIEHGYSFFNGVDKLDLFTENNYTDVIRKNRKWYELYMNTVFLCCSPLMKVFEHKEDLLILKDEKYMGDKYDKLVKEYYQYMKNLLFDNRSDRKIVKKQDLTKPLEENIYRLDFLMHNIELKISRTNLDRYFDGLIKELDYMSGRRIKKAATSMFEDVLNDEYIIRDVLISRLANISNLIENDAVDYIEWRDWFRRFENLLHRYIKINTKGDHYEEYKEVLDEIQIQYPDYVKGIVNNINSGKSLEDNSDNNSKYDELVRLDKNGLNTIREREWRRFRGME